MKTNRQRRFLYLSIFIVILLLSEFIQVNNTNSSDYGISQNSFSPIATPDSGNIMNGVAGQVNLSIREIGINNGTLWDAIINGVYYQTHSVILNLSIQPGDYSISFYSIGAWGSQQNVNLTLGSKKIVEYFYRMLNLSQEYNYLGPIKTAVTSGNYTALLGLYSAQIIGRENGTFQNDISGLQCSDLFVNFLGSSGSNFIMGAQCQRYYNSNNFKIYSYNPNTQSTKTIFDPYSLSFNKKYCCCPWPFSLSAMSVWHNEAFVSFRNTQTQINSIYGLVYLDNSTFVNLTGEFPSSATYDISVCAGNGNYLIGLNNSWFLLNGTTMSVSYEHGISASISQMPVTGDKATNSMMGFNGSSFVIANHSSVIGFNPSNDAISLIYTAKEGNISAIYANSSVILVGIQDGRKFSMIDMEKSNGMQPLFTETNASERIYGCITTIDPSGNIMLLAGTSPDSVYLFTYSNSSGLTFEECGLPKGTEWSVTLDGKSTYTSGNSIDFNNLSSGCYTFSVDSNSSFNASIYYSRFIYEKGQYTLISVQFLAKLTFIVNNFTSFRGYGKLVVNLKNDLGHKLCSCYSSNQSEQHFDLPSGNYSYCAIMTQSYTRGIKGNITVGNGSNTKHLSFIKSNSTTVFSIVDNSQFPQWCIALSSYCIVHNGFQNSCSSNRTTLQGTGTEKKVLRLQDNYFQYSLCLFYNSRGSNNFYKYGAVCVNGSNLTVNLTLNNYYAINITESGIPYNMQYGSSIEYPWTFCIYNNISGIPTIVQNEYYIMSTSLIVCLPDGNYSIKAEIMGFRDNSVFANTHFNVSGKPENIVLNFNPVYYTVFLHENGISPEYKWYANSSSGNFSAYGGTSIKLKAFNGSSCFTLWTNEPNMVADRYCNTFYVNGINKSLTVNFTRGYYVTISEIGLPVNTAWYFGVPTQMEKSTTNTSLSVMYPLGNFTFCANSENHIYSTFEMPSHILSINRNRTLYLRFAQYKENLSFTTFIGGNSKLGFSVQLKGGGNNSTYYGNSTYNGRCDVTVFSVINGTYKYEAKDNNSIFEPVQGSANVSGTTSVMLNFPMYRFYVEFRESGINKETNWGIVISVGRYSSGPYYSLGFKTLKILFTNGTYALTAFAGVPGYGTEMTNYTVKINSTTTYFKVTFYSLDNPMYSNSGILLGSFSQQFYNGVFMIIGISGITSVMLIIRKRVGKIQ